MATSVLRLADREPVRGAPVARKGFRPFFLLASGFACGIVPLWMLVVAGVARPPPYLDPITWHAHEMVLGFAVAVVAGFLLTAVGNWTQRETATGAPLLGLAALWMLGRVAMLAPQSLPRGVPAAIDLAFLPALITALARPLFAAKSRRNFVMLGILGALLAANVVVHLDALGVLPPGSGRRACLVGVDVLALVMLIIAGRVVPMFTRNATGVETIRSIPLLDALVAMGMAALALMDALDRESVAAAATAAVVGAIALARTARWGAQHTARTPLLWILHLGHLWIPVGLLLRAAAALSPAVPESLATHALTVGAIGSLTIGMMARVALGHTGRRLVAPRLAVAGFVLVTLAVLARVVFPLLAPGWYFHALIVAATSWAATFLAYFVSYVPILLSRRVDEKADSTTSGPAKTSASEAAVAARSNQAVRVPTSVRASGSNGRRR